MGVGKKLKGKYRSYSQFSTFGMCPRKWQLSKKFEPKIIAAPLAEGDIFHLAVGKMYAQNDPNAGKAVFDFARNDYLQRLSTAKASQEQIDRLTVKFAALEAMITCYAKSIFSMDMTRFEVLETEKEFRVKAGPGLVLGGFIDGIWRDKQSGVRFIVEHKYKSAHEPELMPLDLQVSLYTLALLEEYGPLPTLYNVALKPANRQGKNETTAEFVTRLTASIDEEMQAFRWTPGDFKEKRFVRQTYSRGRAELTAALSQIRTQHKAMTAVARTGEAWRNVGDHCLWMCPFKNICIEEDALVIDRFFDRKDLGKPAPAK
jgi:hypothetical protein